MNDSTLLPPPNWSLQVGSLGTALVLLAIASFVISGFGWLVQPRIALLGKVASIAFTAGCVSLFGAFASLATLFVANRLEFEYVWGHGDGTNTIPYRIAGIWAGQQGSFLLWAVASSIFGLVSVRGTGIYRRWYTIVYSGFLTALSGILAYETPFKLNLVDGQPVVPASGVGLSPALQNYWVTIHPPTIFLGFGALTVLAAYAFSAMATGRLQEWVPMVRPWSLVALTLVGVGLCMGGFWAYETLGWGGFWMWDPVENVSFVPWVLVAAFVHGIMVQVAKKKWVVSNLLLGGLPFLLFVYGTFLTRSGALNETSVHSFAEMDKVAHKLLLGFLGISTATFLGLWAWRGLKYKPQQAAEPAARAKGITRDTFYLYGIFALILLGIGAALGMSMPLFMAMAGQQPKVVEEDVYHKILTWAYVPLMLTMAAGPLASWRAMGAKEFLKRIYGVSCVTLFLMGLAMIAVRMSPWTKSMDPSIRIDLPFHVSVPVIPWILLLAGLSIAVIVSSFWRITEIWKQSKVSSAAFLMHIGVAVLMAGLIISRGFEQKVRLFVQEGAHDVGLGYFVAYKGQTSNNTDRNNKVLFDVRRGKEHWVAAPGYYLVTNGDGQTNPMVWPYIEHRPLYDMYFALSGDVIDATQPTTLAPGESTTFNNSKVTYIKRTMEGEPGKSGTKFGALLQIDGRNGILQANPKIQLGGDRIIEIPDALDSSTSVILKQLDASSGSATISFKLAHPVWSIDMFYKPLTGLVWLGTGIMALAGFLSAWYRRRPKALATLGSAEDYKSQSPSDANTRKREKSAAYAR